MRVMVAALLCAALTVPGVAAAENQPPTPAPTPAVSEVLRQVGPYTSTWADAERDIASLTDLIASLTEQRRSYQLFDGVLAVEQQQAQAKADTLAAKVDQLAAEEAATAAALAAAEERRVAQERLVGGLARLLYTQPSPELSALEQVLGGEDLRAFDRRDLVTDVLGSKVAELESTIAEIASLTGRLGVIRADLEANRTQLRDITAHRDQVVAARAVIEQALAAIAADERAAEQEIDALRKAAEEEMRAAAAAAAATAAAIAEAERAAAAAQPAGGGAPAKLSSGEFSARLPAWIPFREHFLTYGIKYRVEPALLAAIAAQESNFNPNAGCPGGGGKGIMQLEYQEQYCGAAAVPASIERAAIMLASYYNRSDSWTAAIFAYNNGPGLLSTWVKHSDNKQALLAALAQHYNKQSFASAGPYQGYPTWGDWRAMVAYSYAAPRPDPGFRSATQKWLIYRQG